MTDFGKSIAAAYAELDAAHEALRAIATDGSQIARLDEALANLALATAVAENVTRTSLAGGDWFKAMKLTPQTDQEP